MKTIKVKCLQYSYCDYVTGDTKESALVHKFQIHTKNVYENT